MNNKVVFSIGVVLCIVSFGTSLISGTELVELVPAYTTVLISLLVLKQKNNSLK